MSGSQPLEALLAEVRACRHCAAHLPLGPRPVLRATPSARILIVGQAPGTRVHESGVPWNDRSGDRLRDWLALDRETFYDTSRVAIIPMGFCYPGHHKGTDRPPRPECAPLWQARCDAALANVRLTLLIGAHAQRWALGKAAAKTLTETVAQQSLHMETHAALPHPSGRNNVWLARNPWFEHDVLPALRQRIRSILADRD